VDVRVRELFDERLVARERLLCEFYYLVIHTFLD
jgi:hypothetical protein